MTEYSEFSNSHISKKTLARIAGFFYLLVIITGGFAEIFVRQKLVVPGDALETAENIKSAEMLYRLGFMADLANFILGLPSIVIMYILFKPVQKNLTLLAIFFVIIQTAIIAVNMTNQLSPLLFLRGDKYLDVFQKDQLAALALNAIHIHAQGYAIGLVFFGFYCLIIGYLITRSALVPRILGVLYIITGICYVVNSCTMFLLKGFANPLFPYILMPPFVGEVSLSLWLLIKGVKEHPEKQSI